MRADAVPDASEPVFGYRAWLSRADGPAPRLTSVFRWVEWPVGKPLRAECQRWGRVLAGACGEGDGRIPEACECGIYGLHMLRPGSPSLAEAVWCLRRAIATGGGEGEPWEAPADWILGVAAGWGRVVIASEGWRASFARPVALFRSPRGSRSVGGLVERLAADYGVPLLSEDPASSP